MLFKMAVFLEELILPLFVMGHVFDDLLITNCSPRAVLSCTSGYPDADFFSILLYQSRLIVFHRPSIPQQSGETRAVTRVRIVVRQGKTCNFCFIGITQGLHCGLVDFEEISRWRGDENHVLESQEEFSAPFLGYGEVTGFCEEGH